MGYRSQVHSLIYGPEDKICALVAKHTLLGGGIFTEHFKDDIRRFKVKRSIYDHEATVANEQHGDKPRAVWTEHAYEVIELKGDSWKWYESYPDVQAWEALLQEAANDFDCNYEFVRIGEEPNDIQLEYHVEDGGDVYLGVNSSIYCDIVEETE
jgi:hypothetical protein